MSEYLNFPADGIGFSEEDRLLRWMSEHRDPELWHQLALQMDHGSGLAPKYLLWVVSQPDCDVATALATFLVCEGFVTMYVDGPTSPDPYWDLATTICGNTASGFYTHSKIANPEPHVGTSIVAARQQIIEGCEQRRAAGKEPPLPIPEVLLSWTFPHERFHARYLIEQDWIVRIDTLDAEVREMLGVQFL